ncbi:hypothetical protein MC885_012459, partial [Smutsia gigantea]
VRLNLWPKSRTTIHRVHHSSPAPPTTLRPPCNSQVKGSNYESQKTLQPRSGVPALHAHFFEEPLQPRCPLGGVVPRGPSFSPLPARHRRPDKAGELAGPKYPLLTAHRKSNLAREGSGDAAGFWVGSECGSRPKPPRFCQVSN